MKIKLATGTHLLDSTAFYVVAGKLEDLEYKQRRKKGTEWNSWGDIREIGDKTAKKYSELRWAPSGDECLDIPKIYTFKIYYKKGDYYTLHKFISELDKKIVGTFSCSTVIQC